MILWAGAVDKTHFANEAWRNRRK